MKSAAISRFVIVAAIAVMNLVGGSTKAWAACPASPNYTPDFSVTPNCFTANGFSSGTAITTFPSLQTVINPPTPPPTVTTALRLTQAASSQVGSVWYNTPQTVQNGFSTSFQFELTPSPNVGPADGIAFVIQNSPSGNNGTTGALHAIGFTGGEGGPLGYGDSDESTDPSSGAGISKSLAIEFDTYKNGWDPSANTEGGSVSHVAIQSCGQGPNTSHHNSPNFPQACSTLTGAANPTIAAPVLVANLSDGNPHTVTITYTPACSACSPATAANIRVLLDNVDIFGAVKVDLSSIGLATGGTAYVGFTGSTGGSFETQDILNWSFTPQQQSGAIVAGAQTPTVLNFSGGPNNGNANGYEYDLQLDATGNNNNANPGVVTGSVTTILMDQKTCNKLVQKTFPLTQCFVFQNADGKGNSGAVLFELTCPGFNGSASSQCGDTSLNNFAASLGTSFNFLKSQNLGFQLLNSTIGPYPGWLKGDSGVAGHPCAPDPNNPNAPLFQSNQITAFSVQGDPLGTTKGKSGGGGSCWVATFATTGELPPGIKVAAPLFTNYLQNKTTPGTALYTCSNPVTSKDPTTSAKGPYLTVNSCRQSQSPNPNGLGQLSCTLGSQCSGQFDLSVKGLHAFTVTSKDTGGNVNAFVVVYNVK